MTMTAEDNRLTGLWFDGQRFFGSTMGSGYTEDKVPVFEQTARWLDAYFDGTPPDFTPPLALHGTPFREAVWGILQSIPFGRTMSYKEVATEMARQSGVKRMSAQAAGSAVGHNPVSLIVPCHRVIGADGSLVGYAGGTDKKAWLLNHEGARNVKKD